MLFFVVSVIVKRESFVRSDTKNTRADNKQFLAVVFDKTDPVVFNLFFFSINPLLKDEARFLP